MAPDGTVALSGTPAKIPNTRAFFASDLRLTSVFATSQATLDDLLHDVYSFLDTQGHEVRASRGATLEVVGVLLELTNPRARLSRSDSRGKIFSCLGELCWYLSGDDALAPIEYYLGKYRSEAINDGTGRMFVPGAYGPRLTGGGAAGLPPAQLEAVIAMLGRRSSSRRAVLQLFSAADLPRAETQGGDVPCTCVLQFLVRDDALHLLTYMRSNDAVAGLTHDVFCFTMLQELVARRVGVELGSYQHMVGSLHVYLTDDKGEAVLDREEVRAFLHEGHQSTLRPMPAMPMGDPRPAVEALLRAERCLRAGEALDDLEVSLDPYWGDLVRLLRAWQSRRNGRVEALHALRESLASPSYATFISRLIERPVVPVDSSSSTPDTP